MENKIEFTLNFEGFYDSIHNDIIDEEIESSEIDPEQVDFRKTFENYAKNLVESFSEEIDIPLEFISLWQPTSYNYHTDEITISMNIKYIGKLLLSVDTDAVNRLLKDWSTDKSGYMAFYSYEELVNDLSKVCEAAVTVLYQKVTYTTYLGVCFKIFKEENE